MEGEPLDHDPSPLLAFQSHTVTNPLLLSPPFSTYDLLYRPFLAPSTKPPESLSQPASDFIAVPQLPSSALRLCKDLHQSLHSGMLLSRNGVLQESDEEKQQYTCEANKVKNNGGSLQHGGGSFMSGKEKGVQDQMYGKERSLTAYIYESSRDDQASVVDTAGSPGAFAGQGSPVSEAPPSCEEDVFMSSGGGLDDESENENTNSNDGSSSKDTSHDLTVHEDEKGEVSPLRALSHIAHIKQKQDCMQVNSEQRQDVQGWDGQMHEFSAEAASGSPSGKKKFKEVQFRLESLTYQRLTRLLVEQHQGSFQRFVMAALNSFAVQDKMQRKTAPMTRRTTFSKWKRTRFDQLKGTETQELAQAFRSLAEAMPSTEVPSELIDTPWQELNMLQIQKMLEETKKLLLVSEKVHDCPYTGCGRRFSTPGNLKDHLNEHSGEQPYSCSFEDCPHRFRSKQHLCRHMKKHERAHTCMFEGCNKRFAFRERLIVHQKIHSDERPLVCPWEGCGKTFKWANSLHGHMRTHTGEKPFQCTFTGCGRLFGYKVDLTRHQRTHFGQPARASH